MDGCLSPVLASAGAKAVSIQGHSDFTGTTAVKFGGTAASSFTLNSKTSITAVVGSGSSGKVTVTTYGGTCSSIGDFTFDNTPPTDPTSVQSASHTISTWSGDNTIDVTWTDTTDAGSGLDGYSILWDTNAATIPDAVKDIEEGVQTTTSTALADGNSHYFHIRSVDNAGNWQSTVHLGPFFIDTTPPKKERRTPVARPAPLTAGDTFIGNKVSTTGVFKQSVITTSADGKVQVIIEKGVKGLSEEGKRLSWITVRPVFYTPPPAGAHIIGLAYRFQPSGATFDPPITITYTYDESEIPAGIAEEDLVIAVWDEANGQWVELTSTVDPVTNTITTQVSHFTVHAIIAPAPAAFSLSGLSVLPAEVELGEPITVSMVVANTGGEAGSYTTVLKINGAKEEEKTVTIAAGSSQTVSFRVTKEEADSYTATVDGLSGGFTVVAPPAPAPFNWWFVIGPIIGVVVIALLLIYFLVIRRRAY